MKNSSLKLGAYPKKEKFFLLIRDWRFWKTLGYSILAAQTLASTVISFVLGLAIYNGKIHTHSSFYISFTLIVLALALLFPLGTFAEFFCAESEHSTKEIFYAESARLDLAIIKKLNIIHLFIILPINTARSILNRCKQKATCIA